MILDNFKIERQKDGTFLYKAKENKSLLLLKKEGKDKPQYPVIYKMEGAMKERGKNMVLSISKQITNLLKEV